MFCKHCGVPLEDTVQTCPNCGTDLTEVSETVPEVVEPAPEEIVEVAAEVVPEPVPAAAPSPVPEPAEPAVKVVYKIPPENEPLGAWTYFWLKVLFSVPIVGFIFLMIFTFHGGNLNRRSFARSYWCELLVVLIIITVLLILVLGLGLTFGAPVFKSRGY